MNDSKNEEKSSGSRLMRLSNGAGFVVAIGGFLLTLLVQSATLIWWAAGITNTQRNLAEAAERQAQELVALRKDFTELAKISLDNREIQIKFAVNERRLDRLDGDLEKIKELAAQRAPLMEDLKQLLRERRERK